MKIQQIRNATLVVTYGGKKFLIDTWLMPKDYMPGFDGAVNAHIRQPRVELPVSKEEIVRVDAVILSHFHPDHWDEFAARAIDKDIPFFVQSSADADIIKSFGFKDVRILKEKTNFEGITLHKTACQHGKREIIQPFCEQIGMPYDSMGVIFKVQNEKTLYLAGDTIWCDEVKHAIDKYLLDVIIVNACGASTLAGDRLIMDIEDIQKISSYASKSIIVASHMDTVSHLTVTRNDIKKLKLSNMVVPDDGETLAF